MLTLEKFFYIDNLSLIILILVGYISLSVISFSSRYLKGDRKQKTFYFNLIILISAIFVMVSTDNLVLLFIAWAISNLFLTKLMLHKSDWQASRASASLALQNFAIGLILLGSAFSLLYYVTGKTSIQNILIDSVDNKWKLIIISLIFLSAMMQSALWPFHRWIISSLNSPTPVSAMMHAGVVNGGGYILVRFAPLFLEQSLILNIIFIIGIITALLGTLWKLMQNDIKRMLACSTVGQMGFMIAQCGLGLFPAAIAHLCWHGLFKAYLFLSSGSAAQEKRLDLEYPPKIIDFALAIICGIGSAYTFSLLSRKNISNLDTTIFLTLLAMIAGTQFSLSIIRKSSIIKFPIAFIITLFAGSFYGLSVYFIEWILEPLNILAPQPLNILHIIALFTLLLAWLAIIFGRQSPDNKKYPEWILKNYVYMLNLSQPHPNTITTHRNQYQF